MSKVNSDLLQNLNESQKEAVTATEGPVLVVAGPGTGKTMTIVHRIAWLVDQGVEPGHILAVTFTNRAAREMRERVDAMLGRDIEDAFIGTFHSLGIRIVSECLSTSFAIYDRDDQIELLREILSDDDMRCLAPSAGSTALRTVAEKISMIKNLDSGMDEPMQRVYDKYQAALARQGALDFDDLILKPLRLLDDGGVLDRYRDMFRHIIVDEYQDINPVQYRLIRLLAGDRGNICAVGDPDQAIYAFRGADVSNFLNFGKDFRGARRITLDLNYRSTATVLNASGAVICHNQERLEKELAPLRERGTPVTVISVPDERAEGEVIVREIEEMIGGTSHYQMNHSRGGADAGDSWGFSDFGVIYRTNAQVKAIEEAFIKSGIPCQVVGRTNVSRQKRVSQLLSWLKALINPNDDLNVRRAAAGNKGLGRQGLSEAAAYARENGTGLYEAIKILAEKGDRHAGGFVSSMKRLAGMKEKAPSDELLRAIIDETGIRDSDGAGDESFRHMEDLAAAYRDLEPPQGIVRLVHDMSIMTPADTFDPRAQAVTLMTMHMAKGLEFRAVFIAGCEDGLIPYTLRGDDTDIEEERRLFYVAMTRAKDCLFLIHARRRFMYGQRLTPLPSPFIREIPEEFLDSRVVPDREKKRPRDPQMGLF